MANEITQTVNLTVSKNNASSSFSSIKRIDMTGSAITQATQSIGTTAEVLALGDIVTAPGNLAIKNLDTTNFVEISDGRVSGTGTGYLINNGAGYAISTTSLTLDTGSGTILAGDTVVINGNNYVVTTALAANVITIASPGLVAAVADNASVTILPFFKLKIKAGQCQLFSPNSATIYAKADTAAVLIQALAIEA